MAKLALLISDALRSVLAIFVVDCLEIALLRNEVLHWVSDWLGGFPCLQDLMKSLLLDYPQGKDVSGHYDQEWNEKSAPESGDYANYPAKKRHWVQISVPYSRHSNDYAPHWWQVVVKIDLANGVRVLDLEHAHHITKDKYWWDHQERHGLRRICFHQRFESKAHVGCEPIAAAEFLCEAVHVHIVVQDSTNNIVDAQEHYDKDEVTQQVVHCNLALFILWYVDELESKRPVHEWNWTHEENGSL